MRSIAFHLVKYGLMALIAVITASIFGVGLLSLARPVLLPSSGMLLLFSIVLSLAAICLIAKVLNVFIKYRRLQEWQLREAKKQEEEEEEEERRNRTADQPALKWAAIRGDLSNSYFLQDSPSTTYYALLKNSLPHYLPPTEENTPPKE